MTFTDLAKAHVRTIVPILVGLVITLALRAGIDLHSYTPFVTSAVTAVYYSAARLAEHYLSPKFGYLLGVAQLPIYGAVGHLKAKKGTTVSAGTHTIEIHADASQALATLKEVERQAKRTAAAVKAADLHRGRKIRQGS